MNPPINARVVVLVQKQSSSLILRISRRLQSRNANWWAVMNAKTSNVVKLEDRRFWKEVNERLALNALIMESAAHDKRLTKIDLVALITLLNNRQFSNMIRSLPGRWPEKSIQRLVNCGYLVDCGIVPNHAIPELAPYLHAFELSEREANREWWME
ncbi:MAG: hypothetical protein IPK79_13815 [Vampirovibrionales bacterium]|nr:hypothetical protein [Vampirovibrionales bacterium]